MRKKDTIVEFSFGVLNIDGPPQDDWPKRTPDKMGEIDQDQEPNPTIAEVFARIEREERKKGNL